jgi:uncharacterized protein (DUF58 family)
MSAAATTSGRFLDLRALAALENMQFVTRQAVDGSYTGRHRSPRHGGAGEFADFREYTEGEDLRHLDWKVLARTGRAYTRLYHDETNLRAVVAIDVSSSMAFGGHGGRARQGLARARQGLARARQGLARVSQGSARASHRSKLEYAQYLAASLVHVIVRGQDQAGLAILSDHLETRLAPGGTPQHEAVVQAAIERVSPRPARRLAGGLRTLYEQAGRRGTLILVSDFLFEDLEEAFADLRLYRHGRWEVVLLHLVHPDEERLPDGTAYRFVGLEGEGEVEASPADLQAEYERRFANHLSMVRSLAGGSGCDYRRVSTAVPYLQTLRGFLIERSG